MRKVTSGLFISLDGVTESPDQWQFDSFDEDMMATIKRLKLVASKTTRSGVSILTYQPA